MPKRSKKERSSRKRRVRTPFVPKILDLPDEVLRRILAHLGLVEKLTPHTIRTIAPSFSLAQTCQQLYTIFRNNITQLHLDDGSSHPPPLNHHTHSDAHVLWLLRNLPKLSSVRLPEDKKHLAFSLPRTRRVEELHTYIDQSIAHPIRFPTTLKKLTIENPSAATMQYLANAHNSTSICCLEKARICSIDLVSIQHLRAYYSNSCGKLEDFYTSFQLSRDFDIRERENKVVTDFMNFVCTSHTVHTPRLKYLSMAVTGASRRDLEFEAYDLEELQPVVDQLRINDLQQCGLRILSLFTDVQLLESWVTAIAPALGLSTLLSLEAGHNCVALGPPIGHWHKTFTNTVHLMPCIASKTVQRAPFMPSMIFMRDKKDLHAMYITGRVVVDKFFHHTSEHREATLAYIAKADTIRKLWAPFTFRRGTRFFSWDEREDHTNLLRVMTHEDNATANEEAYEFLEVVLSVTEVVDSLSVSFEIVSHAPDHGYLLQRVLQRLVDIKNICLRMPRENVEGHPREGFVEVTEKFVLGLPVFLQQLSDLCPKLEQLQLENIGEMTWEEFGDDRQVVLSSAAEAVDKFERKRPTVSVEEIRAMIRIWRNNDGFHKSE